MLAALSLRQPLVIALSTGTSLLHGLVEFVRLLINTIITSSIIATSTAKIKADTINVLTDVSPFPFIGGSLCEPEDITDVEGGVIVGVGLGIIVPTGVEVGTIILDVGLNCGVGMEVGRGVGVGVGCGIQLQVIVVGITPPPPNT